MEKDILELLYEKCLMNNELINLYCPITEIHVKFQTQIKFKDRSDKGFRSKHLSFIYLLT